MTLAYDESLPASDRRDHGVHYTTADMAAEVVRHTLDRLFVEHVPTSNFIRSLRVGDMAMGGGVFLVETVRYLAEKLAAAWSAEGVRLRDRDGCARLVVADECIFGVEFDPIAAANAREAVASFVGKKLDLSASLRAGDALVGLRTAQLYSLDWEPQLPLPYVQEVGNADDDGKKLAGDCVVGAFFAHDKPAARRRELLARQPTILCALAGDEEALATAVAWQAEVLAGVSVFHWPLEFPWLHSAWSDVPSRIDAFVGNPPYVGGTRISGVHGPRYLAWLRDQYEPAGGQTDLCAYFFRRAYDLMGRGAMGLIATKTISQGDTRRGGLKPIVDHGGRIFRAHVDETWPGDANVLVSTVFISKHGLASDEPCLLRAREREAR